MDDTTKSLRDILFEMEELEKSILEQNTRDSTTGSDVTDASDGDKEKPLSHAEESAIEECLNDTEGSLSTVDLNIFDDISDDLPVHKVSKSRQKRTSERFHMDFARSGTDCDSSSLDEVTYHRQIQRRFSLTETSLNTSEAINVDKGDPQTSMDQTINKTAKLSLGENTLREYKERLSKATSMSASSHFRRILRRKRRNSPPIRKNDKTHIFSFFSAMADLVSTFPNDQIITAKYNVNTILHEIVEKARKWHQNKEPMNTLHDHAMNAADFRLIEFKLSRPPFVR